MINVGSREHVQRSGELSCFLRCESISNKATAKLERRHEEAMNFIVARGTVWDAGLPKAAISSESNLGWNSIASEEACGDFVTKCGTEPVVLKSFARVKQPGTHSPESWCVEFVEGAPAHAG